LEFSPYHSLQRWYRQRAPSTIITTTIITAGTATIIVIATSLPGMLLRACVVSIHVKEIGSGLV